MASAPLVEQQIKDGEHVVNMLKEASFDINAALWWYSPESERWILIVATKDVERSGPAASYQKLYDALTKSRETGIYLTEPSISLIDPKHPLVTMLRDYFQFRQEQPSKGTRLTQNMINGYAIEGAYVYCL